MVVSVIEGSVGGRLVLSVAAIVVLVALRYAVVGAARVVTGKHKNAKSMFWARQIASMVVLAGIIAIVVGIWVIPARGGGLPVGLATAGLAVALQKVWTAFAGYLVVMRGRVFSVGDRIAIGGIRGDVMSVGFLYTRIMEMGDPADPTKRDIWVGARQFTGRIVTITNDRVFNDAVFNYTREFPFIYEEIVIPIKYDADRRAAERILLRAAEPAAGVLDELSEVARRRLEEEYFLSLDELTPRVYYRLTDNWLELTLRFVVREHGIRKVKDQISRRILDAFEEAGLEIASATFEVVGVPPLRLADGRESSTWHVKEAQRRD